MIVSESTGPKSPSLCLLTCFFVGYVVVVALFVPVFVVDVAIVSVAILIIPAVGMAGMRMDPVVVTVIVAGMAIYIIGLVVSNVTIVGLIIIVIVVDVILKLLLIGTASSTAVIFVNLIATLCDITDDVVDIRFITEIS